MILIPSPVFLSEVHFEMLATLPPAINWVTPPLNQAGIWQATHYLPAPFAKSSHNPQPPDANPFASADIPHYPPRHKSPTHPVDPDTTSTIIPDTLHRPDSPHSPPQSNHLLPNSIASTPAANRERA